MNVSEILVGHGQKVIFMEKMEKKDLKKSAECLCFFILMDTLKENQRTREKSSDS